VSSWYCEGQYSTDVWSNFLSEWRRHKNNSCQRPSTELPSRLQGVCWSDISTDKTDDDADADTVYSAVLCEADLNF